MAHGNRLAVGTLLVVFVATMAVYMTWRADPAEAARGRSDAWIQQRTTVLLKATRLREQQIARLNRAARRQGANARLRRAALARQRTVLRLDRAVTRLNKLVLAGDHDAEDPLVRRVIRLNRRVCRLSDRSTRLVRRVGVRRARLRSKGLIASRHTLATQTARLRNLQGTSSARLGAATAEPAPTPSPAPDIPVGDAPSSPPPTTSTIVDLVLSQGQSDITYQNVRFASTRRFQQATVTITRAHHITFRDCVFEGSAWNNITINDSGHTVHDISFEDCYVKSAERMGFECTSRGSSDTCYTGIELRGVTFDPQGSEAISFDGPPVSTDSVVKDVLIKGSGTRPDLFPWGQGMEINGPRGFLVEDLTMYRTRGSNWNLNGADRHMDWTFRDIVVDNTVHYLGSVRRSEHANIICAFNVDGSVWQRCTFRNARPGAAMAYLSDCDGNRFAGIGTAGSPTHVSEVDGCSGNIW